MKRSPHFPSSSTLKRYKCMKNSPRGGNKWPRGIYKVFQFAIIQRNSQSNQITVKYLLHAYSKPASEIHPLY